MVFLVLLIIYPNVSLNSAKEGINLWLFVVVPSLFPFFIINDILMCVNIPENIARLFAPVIKKLFNTSGYGAYAFIMSIFSGYPSGAKIVRDLIKDKKITPKEGQSILTFSSTSGPLFIIGAIGFGILKSNIAGYILYISHILGAILNGIFFRFFTKKENNKNTSFLSYNLKDFSLFKVLSNSIMNSIITCGLIGGYIVTFSVIIYLLREIQYFNILALFLEKLISIPKGYSSIISTLLESCLEISNGTKIIYYSSISIIYKLYLISFIIAFSGISIIGQVSGIINNTGIDLKFYVISKIFHGIFSFLSCYLLIHIFKIEFYVFNSISYSIQLSETYLLVALLIIILFLNILGQGKKLLNK